MFDRVEGGAQRGGWTLVGGLGAFRRSTFEAAGLRLVFRARVKASSGSRVRRDQRMVARCQRANGLRDVGQGLAKRRQAIVVDGEDGQVGMPLLLGETLVGGDENGEALRAGLGEQFGVTQRAPPVVHRAFDGRAIEGRLKWKADPRRDSDVEQDLQVPRSSGEVGAGGVLRCSRLDGGAPDS